MSASYKICPICQTPNPDKASVCRMCGTSLAQVEVVIRPKRGNGSAAYDFRYGETDLQEIPLSRRNQTALTVIVTAIIAFILGGAAFAIAYSVFNANQPAAPQVLPSPSPLVTLSFATVTLGPPTATITPTLPPTLTPSATFTPTPCVQTIVTGDSLLGAIARCGHRSRDVLPLVVEMNGLADANSVQVGQQLFIPWPTATIDPNITPTATPTLEAQTGSAGLDAFTVNEAIDAFAPTATPTLPAGVAWHTVQREENLITIAMAYNANAKTLSELNPEIDFARCEFGERFGGPECLVQLYEGQQVRVPAPTPTPTLSPTPDPNATATPTATATVNVPNLISPPDKQFFGLDELITLRWQPTGTLDVNEAYRIDLQDRTLGVTYTAYTRQIVFVVPPEWQGREAVRHEYSWTVGVVNEATPDLVRFKTAPLTFVWQGLVETTK